jgi:hypothetical protein
MTHKIKGILLWVGTAGAIISAVAYISLTVVMIMGFQTKMDLNQQLLFSIIGAVVGISITWMLRGQGVAFAKEEPESKAVMAAYHKAINKTKRIKQLHTIVWHVTVMSIIDIVTKVATVAVSTYFMLYVFMEGSGDYGLLGLAFANLALFVSFGILAMARAYDFYMIEHLAAIKERTDQMGSVPSKGETHADLRRLGEQVPDASRAGEQEQEGHQSLTRV